MRKRAEAKVPKEIQKSWREMQLCATSIKRGEAKLIMEVKKDGSSYYYTKLKNNKKKHL